MMRRFSSTPLQAILLVLGTTAACHRAGTPLPDAADIVEGRATYVASVDTIDGNASVTINRARWSVRARSSTTRDFWSSIAVLDIAGAERDARSIDERTFVLALRRLMESDPDEAAVAFTALHRTTTDPDVRTRARIGLTMALSWSSNWPALARIGVDLDTANEHPRVIAAAGVERWAHALAAVPAPIIEVPEFRVTLPLRRSIFGTPVITVRVNGRPHEFWLDTGASMTLLSDDVASDAGVKLVASDTLAIGVVAGHIPARAVFIDSLSMGPVTARRISAALVDPGALRLDQRMINGRMHTIPIAGVIGTDVLRYLDLILDARAGTITISRPRRDPRAVRNLYWVGYPVVRLVTPDGQPVLFGLDTGAEATYVTTSLLKKQPRTAIAAHRSSLAGLGTQVQRTYWVARSIALSDGDHAIVLHNIPVTPERRWTFVTLDGMLGSDVALASRMHLDFTNGIFDVHRPESVDVEIKVGH